MSNKPIIFNTPQGGTKEGMLLVLAEMLLEELAAAQDQAVQSTTESPKKAA